MPKRFLSFLLPIFVFLTYELNGSQLIPLDQMPEIVRTDFVPFIKDPSIRAFLQKTMRVKIKNSGLKIFGSTVLAYTHKDLKPADVDLVAICPQWNLEKVDELLIKLPSKSPWNVSIQKRRTFDSFYGAYRGAIVTFSHKNKALCLDVFFVSEEDYQKKDPVIASSSKYFDYIEKKSRTKKHFFQASYLRAEDFGGIKVIEFHIRNKILYIPEGHANEAILFRLAYSITKHGCKIANRLTLERAAFSYVFSERHPASLSMLCSEKARLTQNQKHYYQTLMFLLEHSLIARAMESELHTLEYRHTPTFEHHQWEKLPEDSYKNFFFLSHQEMSVPQAEILRNEVSFFLFFRESMKKIGNPDLRPFPEKGLPDSFPKEEGAFLDLTQVFDAESAKFFLSDSRKTPFENVGRVHNNQILKIPTKQGGTIKIYLDLNLKKGSASLGVKRINFPFSKLLMIYPANKRKQITEINLSAIKPIRGPLSLVINEHSEENPFPENINPLLETYQDLEVLKAEFETDQNIIITQSLFSEAQIASLELYQNSWLKKHKKKQQKKRQNKKKKKATNEAKNLEEETLKRNKLRKREESLLKVQTFLRRNKDKLERLRTSRLEKEEQQKLLEDLKLFKEKIIPLNKGEQGKDLERLYSLIERTLQKDERTP